MLTRGKLSILLNEGKFNMSHTVILKNTTASQIIIRDLAGMRIEASSQYEASKNRTLADIQNSG